MKKYLLGLFAVVLAIAFSAFTNNNDDVVKYRVDYYWFDISGSYNLTSPVLEDDAAFDRFASAPTSTSGCNTTDTKQCKSGFTASQVVAIPNTNPVQYKLKDDSQIPAVTPHRKP